MNWPLASFAIVAVALAACFWWYERSHPPAKVVAVVATLAALAALGRDAFVALPDVKPTTAIALVTGYAFGAEAGFAVGAVGALASNVLLGQGPWTPWQMLAWGLVGIAGAGVAALTRRRLGRVGLALCCAVAAEGFNLVMNLYTWTLGGIHTLTAYGVILSGALVFDVTHVVASFGFGLAFGPALARMLARVRARLEVRWTPVASPGAAPVIVLALAVATGAAAGLGAGSDPAQARAAAAAAAGLGAGSDPAQARAAAARSPATGVGGPVGYLVAAQNPDGGFGGARGATSSELFTGWAALGLAAAGRNPSDVRRGGHSVLDALRAGAGQLDGSGDLERTILALHASGASVHALSGGDPVTRLLAARRGDGSFDHLVNLTAFGVFALRAAGRAADDPTVRAAAAWLAHHQNGDGGFGYAVASPSDVDDTAAALQALAVGGARAGRTAGRALSFLVASQNPDGGFPQQPGGPSNAQSTAFAVQGLVAGGRDPASVRRAGSRSPLGYLRSLITPDGSVRYSRTGAQTPVWVTSQALLALAERPFPVAPPAPARRAARATHLTSASGPGRPPAHAHVRAAPRARVSGGGRRAPPAAARNGAVAPTPADRAGVVAVAAGRLGGMLLGALVG